MNVRLSEEPIGALAELARVPIAFTVDRVLDVVEREGATGTRTLQERALPCRTAGLALLDGRSDLALLVVQGSDGCAEWSGVNRGRTRQPHRVPY